MKFLRPHLSALARESIAARLASFDRGRADADAEQPIPLTCICDENYHFGYRAQLIAKGVAEFTFEPQQPLRLN